MVGEVGEPERGAFDRLLRLLAASVAVSRRRLARRWGSRCRPSSRHRCLVRLGLVTSPSRCATAWALRHPRQGWHRAKSPCNNGFPWVKPSDLMASKSYRDLSSIICGPQDSCNRTIGLDQPLPRAL